MLLENQSSVDLLNVFIEHRKTALQTVIDMDYSNVRAQISSMGKCLLTTVTLLYECFLGMTIIKMLGFACFFGIF